MISWTGGVILLSFIFMGHCGGQTMTKLCKWTERYGALLRSILMAVLASEGLYLVMVVLFNGVLSTDVFMTRNHYLGPLKDYMMPAWAGAMAAFYLARERRNVGLDTRLLLLLALWIAVPFIIRFGTEFFTLYATYGYAICFIVFYISVRESDAKRRANQLDIACACYCLLSIVLGGALLYCAFTGKIYRTYWDTEPFGVKLGQLQHATHYNGTAMLALSGMLMSLVGLCRSKKKPVTLFYLLGVVIMALVVILTQSRTSRYAMLLVLAVGTWNGLAAHLPVRKGLLRHGVALVCAALVLVGGYKLSLVITDAALAHYAGKPTQYLDVMLPSAIAEEEQAEQPVVPMEARSQKVDASFSDRTNIWKNVINYWRANPKYMIIGNGASRTQWLIHKGTAHEARGSIAVHNAYLHFAAEYGWIGFSILAAFMLSIAAPVLRVFFARGEKRMPGGCALCMLVIAILATGMMESAPLDILTPMGVTLFFALAQLAGAGRELKETK